MSDQSHVELFEKAAGTPVSRETVNKLSKYKTLLWKWQPTINLVGLKTLNDVWQRHFIDSAQLLPLIPANACSLLDMGSGAGFPGLILALLRSEGSSPLQVTLVEADQRKCVFLKTAALEMGLDVSVENARLEEATFGPFDCITARALAPLPDLLRLAAPLSHSETRFLFLKGKRWKEEVDAARNDWTFDADSVDSLTDSTGRILILNSVHAVK